MTFGHVGREWYTCFMYKNYFIFKSSRAGFSTNWTAWLGRHYPPIEDQSKITAFMHFVGECENRGWMLLEVQWSISTTRLYVWCGSHTLFWTHTLQKIPFSVVVGRYCLVLMTISEYYIIGSKVLLINFFSNYVQWQWLGKNCPNDKPANWSVLYFMYLV